MSCAAASPLRGKKTRREPIAIYTNGRPAREMRPWIHPNTVCDERHRSSGNLSTPESSCMRNDSRIIISRFTRARDHQHSTGKRAVGNFLCSRSFRSPRAGQAAALCWRDAPTPPGLRMDSSDLRLGLLLLSHTRSYSRQQHSSSSEQLGLARPDGEYIQRRVTTFVRIELLNRRGIFAVRLFNTFSVLFRAFFPRIARPIVWISG